MKCKNGTTLLKEVWEIRKRNGTPKIIWETIRTCRFCIPNSKRCFLCLNEKYEIAAYIEDKLFKKRTETMK